MESCSSGEEVVVKVRKPYTITKQRERWTEEEHNRFLEAVKLYGRAWQRIEEHIGTKTAIQIRSHAQKFFTKLEKEALTKGIPPGQTLDIEIPPPRPKRKPSNPYPRKTGVVASSSTKEEKQDKALTASDILCPNVEASEIGKGPPQGTPRTTTLVDTAEVPEMQACTDALPLFDDPHTSVSSKGSSGNPVIFKGFVPMTQKEEKGKNAVAEEKQSGQCTCDVGDANMGTVEVGTSQTKTGTSAGLTSHGHPESIERLPISDCGHGDNFIKHIPPHPGHEHRKEEAREAPPPVSTMSLTNQTSAQTNTNPSRNPSFFTISEQQADSSVPFIHHPPGFSLFCLPHNHDLYRSFFNASSTFSNFIVSTLLQNPAAHSAATHAASFWPPQDSNINRNSTPEILNGMLPGGHVNPPPSMAVIASATVAAATAWWAMHGLLPLCHPFPAGFPFVSAATATHPTPEAGLVEEKSDRRDDAFQVHPEQEEGVLNFDSSDRLMLRCSASKSAPSSDSDASRRLEKTVGTDKKLSGTTKLASTSDATFCELNKGWSKMRKTCCHNCGKHSCSEAAYNVEESLPDEENLEESLSGCASIAGTIFSRYRSIGNCLSETRKEVSEEGRLAFQALFSREELPQSFSPPPPEDGAIEQCTIIEAGAPSSKLNDDDHAYSREHAHSSHSDDVNKRNNGNLSNSISRCEKGNPQPRSRHLGFIPYKRCSIEANVGRANSEEKGSKRLHMEGKASNL